MFKFHTGLITAFTFSALTSPLLANFNQPNIKACVANCKNVVIANVYKEAAYGVKENVRFSVLTTSDVYKPTCEAILAEIDFVESETERWIVSFSGDTCQINWAQEFSYDR